MQLPSLLSILTVNDFFSVPLVDPDMLASFLKESVMMQFCGTKLDKKDFFGKSDPFLVFYRSNEDGT